VVAHAPASGATLLICHRILGESLTKEALQQLIRKNKGITAILFMGGDANPAYINKLAEYLYHNYPNLKIGWYSGRDKLSEEIQT